VCVCVCASVCLRICAAFRCDNVCADWITDVIMHQASGYVRLVAAAAAAAAAVA